MRTVTSPLAAISIVLLMLVTPASPLLQFTGAVGSRSALYATDFESGTGGWTHGGAKDEWVLGNPTSGTGGCHSGNNCWATTLNDTYAPDANEWLQSPSIDLRWARSARLDYWHYYDLFNFMGIFYDIGYLEVSADSGSSYKQLMNFTGNSTAQTWEKVTVNLTSFVGSKVLVRFRLVSDSMFEANGWFIDDFSIMVNETGSNARHDLAVVGLQTNPAAPNAGQDIQVDVLVKDAGSYDEKGAQVTFSVQDAKDDTVVFTQSTQIDLLTMGSTFKLPFTWRPMWSGDFKLTGKVSIDGDSQPGNDSMTVKIAVGSFPHDVAITKMAYAPKDPKVGMQVTISVTVRNMGSSDEKRVRVHIRITTSTDALVLEDQRPINDIGPNELRTVDFTWTPTAPDLFIARANVDLPNDPTMEDNRAEIYILVARKGVDMGVIAVQANPKDAAPMARRTIGARVMDIGDVNATNVVVSYTVSDDKGVKSQGNTTYSLVVSGEIKQVTWDVYPDHPGVYTVKVRVTVAGDVEPDNDEGSTTFTVHSVYRDVGVESLSVVPRTEDVNITRSIVAEVANYGDINESFRTTVRVLDQAGGEVLTKDFDVTLAPGKRTSLTAEFMPKAYGNYTATVNTYLSADAQHANDAASTAFYAVKPAHYDLGLEVLTVEPRTGYPDVVRTITADVSNNGDATEDGAVNFTIIDGSGNTVAKFGRAAHVASGAMAEVNGSFTPVYAGNFNIIATVAITGGHVDQEPRNDRMNVTLVSVPRPAPVDLSVDAIAIDPNPGVAGLVVNIVVVLSNLGVDATKGQMNLEVKDPGGKTTTQKLDLQIGPKAAIQVPFTMTPAAAGLYTVKAHAEATGGIPDSNMSNNDRTTTFTVVDLGTRDAAVTALTVSTAGGCGMTLDVKATVSDKGTATLGAVPVQLEVTGNGKTFTYNTTVSPPKGGQAVAGFSFTAPKAGVYQFTVKAKATGDIQPSNDAMTKSGEACDHTKVKTKTTTGFAAWPFILLLIIIAVVAVVYYNYLKDKKRRSEADLPAPPTARPPPARSPARPPTRQRPIR